MRVGLAVWCGVAVVLATASAPVCADPQRPLVAVASERLVRLFDSSGAELQALAHDGAVHCVAFSADGRRLFTAGEDRTLRSWIVENGALDASTEAHPGGVLCMAVQPGGRLLATGGGDNAIKLWASLAAPPVVTIAAHSQPVKVLAWSWDGAHLASAGADRLVQVWRADGGLAGTIVGHDEPVTGLAWSRDRQVLLTSSLDGFVRAWRLADFSLIARQRCSDRGVSAMDVSPDGRMMATGGPDGRLRLWDIGWSGAGAAFTEVASATVERSVTSLAWLGDGSALVAGSADRSARVFRGRQLAAGPRLAAPDGSVSAVAVFPWMPPDPAQL
ncbi:MAG TPA: WD40 repeat domain-containing protein [Chthonomonadales bacterium]|nr:WD40 repeat domain-containing protein [Chthonomonadales bacterium]